MEPSMPMKPDSHEPQETVRSRFRLAPKTHVETEGEKRFNFRAYNLVGYIANALLSVASVYWVERTHSGRAWLDKFGDKVADVFRVNPDSAKLIARKSFFLSGGFAVLLPIKWMENAKVSLVEKWDRQIYGDKVDTDPVIMQSHRELEAEPKQGWLSIMASRALALVPFYITVGVLWDRSSLLSRWTNSALRGKNKAEIAAMEKSLGEVAFNQVASKGVYFDRPIAWASRKLGKLSAWMTGDKAATEAIGTMEAQYPGMIKHAHNGVQDGNRSVVPYYFISEAITSGMVAWGVFALTRVLGPLFGKKPEVTAPVSMAEKMGLGEMGVAKSGPAPMAASARQQDAPGTRVAEVQHQQQAARELVGQRV